MGLYICIVSALFFILAVSVTDCGDNLELKKEQKLVFSNSIYRLLFVSLIFLLWFLTAFRGESIGNDTKVYLDYYKDIARYGVDSSLPLELGYQYFCLLLSKINSNPYFLLIICSTICYIVCGIYIFKHSSNILYSTLLMFCIVFPFFASGIRQSIAMSIVLLAYSKIKENKKVAAIILILFASIFHISAFMALLWFAHKYIPKKPIVVITFALVISALAASGAINSLLIRVLQQYQGYFESEYAGTGWLGITYYTLRATVFYLFVYIAYRNEQKKNSLAISNAVLLLITVTLGFAVNLFNRASLYFLLIVLTDLPNSFNSGKIQHRKLWMYITGIVMLAYFLVTLIYRPEWNKIYPYQFNWN